MPRYFVPLSRRELEEKLIENLDRRCILEEEEDIVEEFTPEHRLNDFAAHITYGGKIKQDLSKIEFDIENFCIFYDKNDPDKDCMKDIVPKLTGYHVYPNGLTAWGMGAGGDWEVPIFLIIYWDGTDLRGYIPKDGNLWNTDNKKAYGNSAGGIFDPIEDISNVEKRFGIKNIEYENIWKLPYDADKIEQDIMKRLLPKP